MPRKTIRAALTALSLVLLSLTAATAQEESEAIQGAQLVDILALDGEVFHVQGVDLDSRRVWITSVDLAGRKGYLHEFDRHSGALLRRLELTDGPRYHPGGISLHNGSIWVAVAEMTPDSSATLMEIDTGSFRVRRRIPVADHLGCVAVAGRTLIAGNWDSRLLHIFDLASGKPVRVVPNPFATRYQDIKLVDGQLVAGGLVTPFGGAIDWIDWPSMKLVRTARTGLTDRARPYTGEGMALKGRDLFLVPEDGPSRLFHFRLGDGEA
jgi:hypothetical protein